MENKILKLEPFTSQYLEKSYVWCNDPIIQKLIDCESVTKEQQTTWYESLKNRKDYIIWGVSCNGFPVGVCGLKNVMQEKGVYWGYIGEKKYWGGLGRQLVALVENKAKILNLKKILLCVLYSNFRAKHLYEEMGYKEFKRDLKFIYYYKDI